MVALLRLLEHREILVHLRLVLERRAVDALELRVFLVALVVGARDVREPERADVPRAHDVRPGAQIEEVAVAEERDLLALRDVREIADFEFARIPRPRSPSPPRRPLSASFTASSRETCTCARRCCSP